MKKMMITLLIFSFSGGVFSSVQAQSFSFGDLFGQQSKKKQQMIAQVAGIYTYLDAVKSGYRIMQDGLDLSQELKGGTFGLHTNYFLSLEQVIPAVKQNPKGKAIADLYVEMKQKFTAETDWQQKQQQLRAKEMAYLQKVSDNMNQLAAKDITELNDLLTPGKFRLTDQERLDRLDKIYAAMKDKLAFAASFTAKCRALAQNRLRAKAEKEQMKKLYGIQ